MSSAPARVRVGAAITLIAAVAVAVAGCNQLVLRTADAAQTACDAALLSGRLVSSRESGLAVQPPGGGANVAVTWPFGYKAGGFAGGLELLDETGRVVAREGDLVEMGGGMGGDGSFFACAGSVSVVAAPT